MRSAWINEVKNLIAYGVKHSTRLTDSESVVDGVLWLRSGSVKGIRGNGEWISSFKFLMHNAPRPKSNACHRAQACTETSAVLIDSLAAYVDDTSERVSLLVG